MRHLMAFTRGRIDFALVLLLFFISAVSRAQTFQHVLPSQTDPNITQYDNYHFICLNTNVTARGQLFVMMPGTGGRPSGYTNLLKTAANLGFHALGLMYPNGATMNSLCADSTNPDCYAETRLAVINGGTNAQITIASYDSITNRLIKLLEYLNAANPGQQWNQFLTAQSNLNWSKIVIAGHSQGAGHAGLIAKVYPVSRSVMFSDTDWWTPGGQLPGQPANWISSPGITSNEFYFGFVHVQDGLIPYPEEIPTWNDYGLGKFGGPELVESNTTPFFGTHMLTTDLPPQNGITGLNCHDATAVDFATPLAADGITPLYQPVWQYMMAGPPELPRPSVALTTSNQLSITFSTYTNYSYQLQSTTNLSSSWSNLGTAISGDGTLKTINSTNSVPAQFFRIQVLY